MTLTVATYNLGDARSTALDNLARTCHVIGEQEAGDRDRDNRAFLAAHETWDHHGLDLGQQRGKVPILHDTARLERLASGFVAMDDGQGPGKPGAGGGERKWLLWERYLDRDTGGQVTVANTHFTPSLRYPNRRRHHAEHARRLAKWARLTVGPLVVTGDFNARWGHRHFDVLRDAGLKPANTKGVTHPRTGRRIDFVLVRGCDVEGYDVVNTPSDHHAVVAHLTIPVVKPEPEEPIVVYRYLTDLADAARKSGLKVVEIDGWERRGRPAYTGGFNPTGVLCHHTGGDDDSLGYVKWMALDGRSDLPAPLCQLALGRDGTVYVCAAGRANHGGAAKATGPMPAGDANAMYVGIEALNNGSEGWTATQLDAYARLCRALCDHYGWPYSHVRAHKETSVTGKWDPGRLDMDSFRVAVADATTGQEDEMQLDDKLWANDDVTVRDVLRSLHKARYRVDERLKELVNRDGEELADAIAAKLSVEVDAAVVKRAVKEALREGTQA